MNRREEGDDSKEIASEPVVESINSVNEGNFGSTEELETYFSDEKIMIPQVENVSTPTP